MSEADLRAEADSGGIARHIRPQRFGFAGRKMNFHGRLPFVEVMTEHSTVLRSSSASCLLSSRIDDGLWAYPP